MNATEFIDWYSKKQSKKINEDVEILNILRKKFCNDIACSIIDYNVDYYIPSQELMNDTYKAFSAPFAKSMLSLYRNYYYDEKMNHGHPEDALIDFLNDMNEARNVLEHFFGYLLEEKEAEP